MEFLSKLFPFVVAYADTAEAAATGEMSTLSMILNFSPFVLIIVVFYFVLIRPQRKREKEADKMRKELEVGDEIITVGGVIGRVVSIREDSLVLETGGDRSKVRIARWAVQQNNTVHDDTPTE